MHAHGTGPSPAVIRRVGGLEVHMDRKTGKIRVIRRVGGLEDMHVVSSDEHTVIRRVGGLEVCATV